MGIGRLLIANRGEVACRIARTAHRLGIGTVGVYSESDADALHVDVVDRAVALGGTTPTESYLQADLLVEAALSTGCDAVHPGYGFLAESAGFARMVVAEGLIWVGPTPEQIALLGDKVRAKELAIEAGVPTAPTFDAAPGRVPEDVPLPLLVKAASGGGGRGMRVVRSRAELAMAVEHGAREAASAFGDGRVFLEPYLEGARHIEVQIVGDAHGSVIHLGERECSIQRRNQKIIEEAPSAGITAETRAAVTEGALTLARAVGYVNAGTVEFLVAEDGEISFLEVNARLQVEHPVTEAVTGLDLVELQLAVASGGKLPLTQAEVAIDGHAIEARLVAEDPATGWLPSAGEVTALGVDPTVRTDAGVRAGSVVTPDYDSLLAKIIARASTRDGAVRLLRRALRSAEIAGPVTNREALVAILAEADFLSARTPTGYLDQHPAVLTAGGPAGDDRLALLLAAVIQRARADRVADTLWGFVRPGWRNLPTVGHRSRWLDAATHVHQVEELWSSDDRAELLVGPWPEPDDDGVLGPDERRRVAVRVLSAEPGRVTLETDGTRRAVRLVGAPERGITTMGRTGSATWTLQPRFADHEAEEAGSGPLCPLPGTVIAVHAEQGQKVEGGDLLMVIEAMKMEHKILAAGPARVDEVRFAVGDRVDAGDLLVRLDSGGAGG